MSATSTPIPDPEVRKKLEEAAKKYVRMNDAKTAVIVTVDDVVLRMPDRNTQQEAKAEWADCLWLVMKLLEEGMGVK